MIAVDEHEHVKLRMVNMHRSLAAIHFHGHKATITAYDGVDQAEASQITRDVFDLAPGQRIDLHLFTENDGLHSYGPGAWMFHDHSVAATTSDGLEPGGNVSMLVYKPLLDEQGMPKLHDELLSQLFNKDYYAKQKAVFEHGDFAQLLGDPGLIEAELGRIIIFGLASGLALGLVIVAARFYKRKSNHAR
jgi:hypothetical protein